LFPDDIVERFRLFLRTTFGASHFRARTKPLRGIGAFG